MSSVPPGLSTFSVDSRSRKLDSPPRICGPKLLVMTP